MMSDRVRELLSCLTPGEFKELLRPFFPAIIAQVEERLAARHAATFSADSSIDADMLTRVVERLVSEQLGQPARESELDSIATEFDLTPSERLELERRVRS